MEADFCYSSKDSIEMVKKRYESNSCCPFYDIILMDLDMPEMDGYEAGRIMNEFIIQKKGSTYIYACSANNFSTCSGFA